VTSLTTETKTLILVALLFAASIATVYYLKPYIPKAMVMSIDKVYIEPTGHEEDGRWVGSFWLITVEITDFEAFKAIKFTAETTERYGQDTIDDKKLVPQATIEISIELDDPYFQYTLERKTAIPSKTAWGAVWCWQSVTGHRWWRKFIEEEYAYELKMPYYDAYHPLVRTPYTVTVKKYDADGNLVWSAKERFDTAGKSESKYIERNEQEWIYIKDLGYLAGEITEAPWKRLLIFDSKNVFEYYSTYPLLDFDRSLDSFSFYWWGDWRWSAAEADKLGHPERMGHPEPWMEEIQRAPGYYFEQHKRGVDLRDINALPPGWKCDDAWYEATLPGYVFKMMPDRPSSSDVLKYLTEKRVRENLDPYGAGKELNLMKNYLKVFFPAAISYKPSITIAISTEMADTIIWTPGVSKGKIQKVWWSSTGTETAKIYGSDTLNVKVKNEGAKGEVFVRAKSRSHLAEVYDSDVETLDSGEVHTFTFPVTNLGVEKETKVTFDIWVTDTFGIETDRTTVQATLMPVEVDYTILEVNVVDDKTGEALSGIPVTITYNTYSETEPTKDGVAEFNLAEYEGKVTISIPETTKYLAAEETTSVKLGRNIITIRLTPKVSEEEPEFPLWAILLIAAIIFGVVAAVIIKRWKRAEK